MRFILFLILLSLPFVSFADVTKESTAVIKPVGILIRNISIEGFVLGDKQQFYKIFKPFRNKYLTQADIEGILAQIELIYHREGYQQLVSISYQVIKHRLVFSAAMVS